MTIRCALVWVEIGWYHNARSAALLESREVDVTTIEVFGDAEYSEFKAGQATPYDCVRLRQPRDSTPSKLRRTLYNALDRVSPQVVFALGWSMPSALVAMQWCVEHGVPCVVMSDTTRDAQPRSAAKEEVKRRILRQAQAAFVAGGPQADYVVELGMPRDQVFLGFDAIDNRHFIDGALAARTASDVVRAELGLPRRYFFICARLIPEKNILRLLEAYAIYRDKAGSLAWPIVQVGPGPLRGEVEDLVHRLGLSDSVLLCGPKDYWVLPKYYGLAGALILPSVSETWGLVVNEAMASGVPVLVSDRCGCAADLVQDGRNGFTFDPCDVNAMAAAMLRMSAAGEDREAMGVAGRNIVANWGLDRFVVGFEGAAKAALKTRGRPFRLLDRLLLRALLIRQVQH